MGKVTLAWLNESNSLAYYYCYYYFLIFFHFSPLFVLCFLSPVVILRNGMQRENKGGVGAFLWRIYAFFWCCCWEQALLLLIRGLLLKYDAYVQKKVWKESKAVPVMLCNNIFTW